MDVGADSERRHNWIETAGGLGMMAVPLPAGAHVKINERRMR
jgi:hypothetical protein